MSDNDSQTEVLAAFSSLAAAIPEMRAGQLMAAVGELCTDLHGRGLWDADDQELLEAIWQFKRNFENAKAASSGKGAEPNVSADRGRVA